jgi:hypothetical protein
MSENTYNESLRAAVYGVYEDRPEVRRTYLGASSIGTPCERASWYGFRDASPKQFSGRLLRLFQRGHREEPEVVEDLRAVGFVVDEVDPDTGKQWAVSAYGGHFRGHADGVVEHPEFTGGERWLLEVKTCSAKRYSDLIKSGSVAEWDPKYWAQIHIYMDMLGLPGCLYVVVCKDNDEMWFDAIPFDEAVAERMADRAERIIFADDPPLRIHDDPARFGCRFCDHRGICHGDDVPVISCHSCAWGEPLREGGWRCVQGQRFGEPCRAHVWLPGVVPGGAEPTAGDPVGGWIEFRARDGSTFRLGAGGMDTVDAAHSRPWSPGYTPEAPF